MNDHQNVHVLPVERTTDYAISQLKTLYNQHLTKNQIPNIIQEIHNFILKIEHHSKTAFIFSIFD